MYINYSLPQKKVKYMGYAQILDTLLTANVSRETAQIIAQITHEENEGIRDLSDRSAEEQDLINEMVQNNLNPQLQNPFVYECFCGAFLTQWEVNEGYCPECFRNV